MAARSKLLLACVLACSATGCAEMAWVRPDTSPEQASLDQMQCANAAWNYTRSYAWGPSPWWGYGPRRFWGPWGPDPTAEEWRLRDFCMRARGYDLVQLPKDATAAAGAGSAQR
jgi:hypothetical protein